MSPTPGLRPWDFMETSGVGPSCPLMEQTMGRRPTPDLQPCKPLHSLCLSQLSWDFHSSSSTIPGSPQDKAVQDGHTHGSAAWQPLHEDAAPPNRSESISGNLGSSVSKWDAARCGGSCLPSQRFGKPRPEDGLSPGVQDQPG